MFMFMISSSSSRIHLRSFLSLLTCFSTFLFLHWSAAPILHLNLLCMLPFRYVRYYFFVTPKTSFVQLQACISLTDHG